MNFYEKVYGMVRKIPRGKVATYGQVATFLNSPRSARMVGWALRRVRPQDKVPWQRVVNRKGNISIVNPHLSKDLQARLLAKEGVRVKTIHGVYTIDLKKYLWKKYAGIV